MSMQVHQTLMSQYKHGEASGEGSVSYESVTNCVTPEIVIYGKCEQNGTPSPDAPVDIVYNENIYKVNGVNAVTPPILYAVGDVRDEYYPLTGKIIRRCKKNVIVGTKPSLSVYNHANRNGIMLLGVLDGKHSTSEGLCSHESIIGFDTTSPRILRFGANNDYIYWIGILDALGMTTVEEFRTWFNEQNSVGTPLTFIYPLLEPIVEYVEPVQLTSVRGTNVIEESGSMTGTQIDVKYLTHS